MSTLLRTTLLALLVSLGLVLYPGESRSQVTSVILQEDFSSGNWWPDGWSDNNYGWYYSYSGKDGYNGSAMMLLYYCYDSKFTSPTVDASLYDQDGDELWLEFDYWGELDYWNANYGPDYFYVYVDGSNGEKELLKLGTDGDYTYDNSSDYGFLWDPETDGSYWRHYKLSIPKSYRTSDLRVAFRGECYYSAGGNSGIDNVTLTGVHYRTFNFTPTTLNFGNVSVGDVSTVQYVTLKNPNPDPVDVTNIAITGADAAAFQIVSSPTFIPGGSKSTPGEAKIGLTYTSSFGTQNATLGFTADVDINRDGAVNLTGTGVAPEIATDGIKNLFIKTRTRLGACRDTAFIVRNSGTLGNLRIYPTSRIEGDNASEYRITQLPTQVIPPGGTDTIRVANCPTMEGGRTASLIIESNAGVALAPILLRGTGILQRFVVDPDEYAFDSVAMGQTACKTFTISNPGSDTLAIMQHYFAYADRDFTLVGLEDSLIPPERSREITVCFAPSYMGTRVARLRFVTNIPMTFEQTARDTGEFIVNIMGTGVPYGDLAITGMAELDSSMVGVEVCRTETLTNVGLNELTITSATITGPDAADFRIAGLTLPLTLRAGQSQNVTLCATPASRGLRNAVLDIRTMSNSLADSIPISLAVYGLQACAQNDVATMFESSRVLIGGADSASVTITNCGDLDAAYTASLPSGTTDYAIVGSATSSIVAPGGTATFWVRFTPSTRGAVSSTLRVTTPGVTDISIPLSGAGAGVTATSSAVSITPTIIGESSTFTVTVTNEGNIDWTTGTPVFSTGAYSYTGTGATIAPGASQSFTVTFTPNAVGPNAATMTFPNANPMETPSMSIALNGQGIALSVRPTASKGFVLEQNYPNPFTPSTTIAFTTPGSAKVRIDLVDVTGELVKTLVDAPYSAGTHQVTVDALDLASGTYFYVLTSNDVQLVRQMTVTK